MEKPWCWWAALPLLVATVQGLDFVYHSHEDLGAYLTNVSESYPNITHLHSIGKSVEGRDLWVLVVGRNARSHVAMRPNVKYVGTIHGNEPVGGELMLHLIELLVSGYGVNVTITRYLDRTAVHFLPMMNPDGFSTSHEGNCTGNVGRANAAGIDLNRNFPDFFAENNVALQPESRAVIDWVQRERFVLSATFHGGAMVANFPFDNYPDAKKAIYAAAPDDDVLRHVSLTYSRHHATMSEGAPCPGSTGSFPDGITNGALWYPVTGGVQDYQYVYAGCVDITMEIGCCKFPDSSALPQLWEDNRYALLAFIRQVHMGVKGLVLDTRGRTLPDADLYVGGREQVHFRSSPYGEFWRLLLPGTYVLHASAPSFYAVALTVTVREGEVTQVNMVLSPESESVPCAASRLRPKEALASLMAALFFRRCIM